MAPKTHQNDPDTEKLLEEASDTSSQKDAEQYLKDKKYDSRRIRRYKCGGLLLMLLLVSTNIGWWLASRRGHPVEHCGDHAIGIPDLTYFLGENEPENVLISFDHDWQQLELVEHGDDGYRYGDAHWGDQKWVPDGGAAVALSRDFVEEHNLFPGAAPLEENATEFHYLVAGYHQLHCLRQVRDAIYYLNGTLGDWPGEGGFMWDHILHCIEAVRQGIHCGLDPTLIPLDSYWPGIQNGQRHVCRNRNALFKWTSAMGHAIPEYTKQGPPARTQEWYDRTKDLDVPPWEPDPRGPPVDESIQN